MRTDRDRDKKIGMKIRMARESSGLTQDDLAKLMNCTPSAISNYERGLRPLTIRILEQIAKATRTNPAFFFEETEEPEKTQIVDIAFEQVRADPNFRFGDRTTDGYAYAIKYDIIRMYEQVTGKKLLPEGFQYP